MADNDDEGFFSPPAYKRYALSGKIMLGAIVILLCIVILMICFHLYVRLYLFPSARRRTRRRPRHAPLVFAGESRIGAATARGLPESVVKSLPVFVYSSKTLPAQMDCAVCLSEFEENETGRVIPNCNHSFHVRCIDMWFYSHSTCPLCRSMVEPVSGPGNPGEVVLFIGERNEPGSSSGPCGHLGPVELPGPADEGNGSGKTTMKFVKSLSFKRMLSREKREGVDLEKEEIEETRSVS